MEEHGNAANLAAGIVTKVDQQEFRLVLSRRFEDIPVDRLQWNALVAQSVGATVFQTHEWVESWWAAFGRHRQLFLISIWDGATLVGIAPLMIFWRAGLRQLEFIGSPNADYQDFVLGDRAEELLPEIACYLSEQRNAWDMLVLRNVPTESATFNQLPELMRSIGLAATDNELVPCPTLQIASNPEEALRALSSYSFRRRMKGLRQFGELNYVRCETQAQIEEYLPLFFQQYVDRRKGTAVAEAFMRPDTRAFYRELASSLLPSGWLHFSVLECGAKPVAFHFGFEFDGRLYWYKPSFDTAFARYSPGSVLLSFLIRDATIRNLKELDFTVGAESFKYRYANAQRMNGNLRAFSRHWLYLGFSGVAAVRRILGRWRRLAIH